MIFKYRGHRVEIKPIGPERIEAIVSNQHNHYVEEKQIFSPHPDVDYSRRVGDATPATQKKAGKVMIVRKAVRWSKEHIDALEELDGIIRETVEQEQESSS